MTNLHELTLWLDSLAQSHPGAAYGILFLSAVAENLFPPAPGDAVTIFGAYLVGRGVLGLWEVILATFLGSTLGFLALFCAAYHYGRDLIVRWRWVKEKHLTRAEDLMRRKGIAIVTLRSELAETPSDIPGAQGMKMDASGSEKGTLEIDEATGCIVRRETAGKFSVDFEMQGERTVSSGKAWQKVTLVEK